MELREFVKEALTEILNGVRDAQDELMRPVRECDFSWDIMV